MYDDLIGLDFETYAEVNLPVRGLDQYVHCPNFRPLIAAVVRNSGGIYESEVFDFTLDREVEVPAFIDAIKGKIIVAHNAGFEQAVLERMGIHIPSDRFIDSAVLARAAGAAGKLEAAAPQLLGSDKLDSGMDLIKLFSIPGKYQEAAGTGAFDPQIVTDHMTDWEQFAHYCTVDAELSLRLAERILPDVDDYELWNNAVTMDMNNVGWHVDMKLVHNMHTRYLLNVKRAIEEFRHDTDAAELNLNSTPQLIAWCGERGVKASSFDEAHVASLIRRVNKRMESMDPSDDRWRGYDEVLKLLLTKQVMGGSSLKKLATIIDTVGTDGRLHDQYLHIGAGATFRTTGRGVQMQNLKRLSGEPDDMLELFDESVEWDNGKLASNLRQVFTATDPDGFLIVGDFSSVESRGLAWQAGEDWKLDAYFAGKDLYKVQAGKIFGKHEAHVTKPERQVGKVGELACGYGAGGPAVQDFAKKMGVDLSETEAAKLVRDWRGANPLIVDYWRYLHQALMDAVEFGGRHPVHLPNGMVEVWATAAPESLRKQTKDPDLRSIMVGMGVNGHEVLRRVIHGATLVGRNIHYWKPSERKTGDLWVDTWTNPKTKRQQPFTVYGGKLSGLLTQSLCREVFFTSLRTVHDWAKDVPNVELVGQFHDEIVLDWSPGPVSLGEACQALTDRMSVTDLPRFPLAAEIKFDYRYTK
jgi:DNA polymerase